MMDINKLIEGKKYIVVISDKGKGCSDWDGCHVDRLEICQNLCGMRYMQHRPELILIKQEAILDFVHESNVNYERYNEWFMSDVMPLTRDADVIIGNFIKGA